MATNVIHILVLCFALSGVVSGFHKFKPTKLLSYRVSCCFVDIFCDMSCVEKGDRPVGRYNTNKRDWDMTTVDKTAIAHDMLLLRIVSSWQQSLGTNGIQYWKHRLTNKIRA